MYLSILVLPFLNYVISNLLGRYIGNNGCCAVLIPNMILCTCLSFLAFYEVALLGSPCLIVLQPWFHCELFIANWCFCFDSLTVVMLVVVSGISTLVHVYSIEYMSSDPHQGRFLGILSLFTFFMLMLISADNLLVMFFGWEGIGLASYLLINFWYTRIQASKSAIKAMLINRVGDLALVIAICSVYTVFKSVDYHVVFSLTPCVHDVWLSMFGVDIKCLTAISMFILLGSLGKSAQIGLHMWLPDAMEAPTPVSALLHAATLVTAGVFLIIKCCYIFEQSSITLYSLSIIGAITALFASSVGVLQNDIKRVIAYSTCSQLGYMMFACGLSQYSIALFHLANHALFKALLFLTAGSIIHGFNDEQDLRRYGSLLKIFPIAYVMILIGSVALTGFPFFTGFYSKDTILGIALISGNFKGNVSYCFGLLAALLTAFYSTRVLLYTFLNKPWGYKQLFEQAHSSTYYTLIPLMILAFGSIFAGYYTKDMFVGFGSPFFGNSVYSNLQVLIIDFEFLDFYYKNIPLVVSCSGIIAGVILLKSSKNFSNVQSNIYRAVYRFLNKKWYFDQIVNEFIVHKLMAFAYRVSFLYVDKGIIEYLAPSGVATTTNILKKATSFYNTGLLNHYIVVILCFIVWTILNYILQDSYFMLLILAYVVIFYNTKIFSGI